MWKNAWKICAMNKANVFWIEMWVLQAIHTVSEYSGYEWVFTSFSKILRTTEMRLARHQFLTLELSTIFLNTGITDENFHESCNKISSKPCQKDQLICMKVLYNHHLSVISIRHLWGIEVSYNLINQLGTYKNII